MESLHHRYSDIPIGKNNAVTKQALQIKWKLSERSVRETIAELRRTDNGDNYVIVSLSNSKGFYRTDNIDEIIAYKRETTNRAKNTFMPLKKINRILSQYAASEQLEFTPINNLKAARREAGLKAQEVVELIKREADPGFNKSDMSRIENNKCFPTAAQLMVMARLYGKTTAELTGMDISM